MLKNVSETKENTNQPNSTLIHCHKGRYECFMGVTELHALLSAETGRFQAFCGLFITFNLGCSFLSGYGH